MNKKLWLLGISAVLLLPIGVAAADYLPKDSSQGGNVVVGGSNTYRNLYVGGGSVIVNKEIQGDLFAAGGSINLAGGVEQDFFGVGGNLNIGNPIGQDARIAGGNITINAQIGGDLLIAGGTISLSPNAPIGGDLWAAGGVLNLNSPIAGNVRIGGSEVFINSRINGTVEIYAEKLTFGPESRIEGSITYHGRHEAIIQNGAVISPITFEAWETKRSADHSGLIPFGVGAFFFIKLAALFIGTYVILKLFRRKTTEIINDAYRAPWKNLLIGIVAIITIPIISIVLLMSLIGAYISIFLILFSLLVGLLASLMSVLFIGTIMERFFKRDQATEISWTTALIGVLVGGIASLIPIIGWAILLIFCIISFGALLGGFRRRIEV